MHIGNTMDDVQGCIAVCSQLGVVNNRWAGLYSRRAFERFMTLFGNGNIFQLEIQSLKLPQQWPNRSSETTTS